MLLPVYGYCQVNEEGSTVRTYVNNADLNKERVSTYQNSVDIFYLLLNHNITQNYEETRKCFYEKNDASPKIKEE